MMKIGKIMVIRIEGFKLGEGNVEMIMIMKVENKKKKIII